MAVIAFAALSPAPAAASALQPSAYPAGSYQNAYPSAYPLSWLPAFNWSDSPLLLDLHQYGGYNDNILNSPPGRAATASSVSQTAFGALGRVWLGPQKFFADARVAAADFLDRRSASLHDRQFDLGWDWRAGQGCQGRLIATASDRQAEAEQASGPGLDTLRLRSVDQDGRCAVYDAFGLAFAAGAASRRHATVTARALDADAVYGKLGLDYDLSQRDHAEFSGKFTATRFLQGLTSSAPGDAGQTDLQAAYRRMFSPLLEARGLIGVSEAPAPADGRSRQVGVYEAELVVTPSDLWRAALAAGRALDAPVSIRASSQVAERQSVSLSWRPTPKLAFTISLARLRLESGPTTTGLYGGSTLTTAAGKAVYQLTPFTSLTASLQRAERALASGRAPTTIAMIGVDFKPY